MAFIQHLVQPSAKDRYSKLGYRENPFPAPGEVRADVFVPRPELEPLQQDLAAFLNMRAQGAVWAVEGAQGVGKSNFLRNLESELRSMEANGGIERTAYCFVQSIALTPQRVVEQIALAIGHHRFVELFKARPSVPPRFQGTDFSRFWESNLRSGREDRHADFLIRWLSGQQTYKAERDEYKVSARERLPPAISFPYLVGLVEMMHTAALLDKIILLLDEFEDVQTLRTSTQTEYALVLKTLLNAFNWKGLYVIIAGAPNAFLAIAEKYPSLSTRWRRVTLQHVTDVNAALVLATEYKRAAVQDSSFSLDALEPSDLKVKEVFLGIKQRPVTQRQLLSELHAFIENLANQ